MVSHAMNALQTVNSWLAQINPRDAGLVLNAQGLCRLLSSKEDDACTVLVPAANSESFHLFQELERLPDTLVPAIYRQLMALNVPCSETRGGMLGVDPQSHRLVFSFSRDIATTDVKMFCTVLENFLDTTASVRSRIAALLRGDGSAKHRHTATSRPSWIK